MGLVEAVAGLPFIEKLSALVEKGELDYWEDRKNPPNLSVDEFRQILERIDIGTRPKWVLRESEDGPHGKDGEDNCFKFECDVQFGGIFGIQTKRYFVKGYFFTKTELKGVTIQSFREV